MGEKPKPVTRLCHCDSCHLCDLWHSANGLPAVPRRVLAGASDHLPPLPPLPPTRRPMHRGVPAVDGGRVAGDGHAADTGGAGGGSVPGVSSGG